MFWRGRPLRADDLADLRAGEIVGVRISGVWHEGIVDLERDETGRPYVWNKSKRSGRVERESWATFGAGLPALRIGYPGTLPPEDVIARARERIGEEWTPIDNCQRFTRACHGVPARSPEADAIGVTFLVAMIGGPIL